jgi:hypothetical protein
MPPNKKIEVKPKAIKQTQGKSSHQEAAEQRKPKDNKHITLHSTIDNAGAENNVMINDVTNPDDYE